MWVNFLFEIGYAQCLLTVDGFYYFNEMFVSCWNGILNLWIDGIDLFSGFEHLSGLLYVVACILLYIRLIFEPLSIFPVQVINEKLCSLFSLLFLLFVKVLRDWFSFPNVFTLLLVSIVSNCYLTSRWPFNLGFQIGWSIWHLHHGWWNKCTWLY